MTLHEDLAQSREYEMRVYLQSMKAMYENAVEQNGETYDICFSLTNGLREITAEAILKDSRIIKTLRYAIAPTISQMKFGQLFGQKTSVAFEDDRLERGTKKYRRLESFAGEAASFIRTHLDTTRFIWTTDSSLASDLAYDYAKKWTCSIAADHNAQTAYRNWRKEQQEQVVIRELIKAGYTLSGFQGTVQSQTDVKIGEYKTETKVKGETVQKADVVFRCKKTRRLVLVEAKAVGVELDATKRIKECANKAEDWTSAPALKEPLVIAVIAGFFSPIQIANLEAAGVNVVWEHRIKDLHGFA
jgi:hypothetical protein